MQDSIKKQANSLITKYNTNNPFELADYLGFITIITPLENNISGISQNLKKNIVIYVNSELDYYKKLIVAAHGLGHAILHKETDTIFLEYTNMCLQNKYEREADSFAIELLLYNKQSYKYKENVINKTSAKERLNLSMLNFKFPHSY